ncbi:hypothetical protein V6N12_015886 [Hibiscus sabdariffa]|uniref:Uncharacterized protein n=1 Tax=Hibiscus sabdariffa TaxID=183260 RepID=A0ABR2DPG9_9ROSI
MFLRSLSENEHGEIRQIFHVGLPVSSSPPPVLLRLHLSFRTGFLLVHKLRVGVGGFNEPDQVLLHADTGGASASAPLLLREHSLPDPGTGEGLASPGRRVAVGGGACARAPFLYDLVPVFVP